MGFRITIRRRERPPRQDIDEDLEWLCSTLGFCSDTQQKTGSDTFKHLLKHMAHGERIGSTKLSEEIGLSRTATIHQLNRLRDAGLIRKEGRSYFLRRPSLYETIMEVEHDMERMFAEMQKMARQLDKEMGFKTREY